jgi:predicted metal-dependent hydrolase
MPPVNDEIPADFWRGIEQFNQGQFYDCHDTLEALWMDAVAPDKTFLQGVLQISVGLYHLSNHNWKGAVILLGEGIRRLVPYQPDYFNIDVTQLIDQSDRLLTALQEAGAEQVEAIATQVLEPQAETISPDLASKGIQRPTVIVLES